MRLKSEGRFYVLSFKQGNNFFVLIRKWEIFSFNLLTQYNQVRSTVTESEKVFSVQYFSWKLLRGESTYPLPKFRNILSC